jgi:hypothetical protein
MLPIYLIYAYLPCFLYINIYSYCINNVLLKPEINYYVLCLMSYFDGMQGRNGSLHVNVRLGGLEAHPVLAVRLKAANPAKEENINKEYNPKILKMYSAAVPNPRSASKNLNILTPKIVSKLSEI